MIIDNVEALKNWLTQTLTPICDADPLTLAKYVVALVKKEKTEADLRDLCTRELDVFLQDKTKDFVEGLFKSLQNKDYVTATASNSAASLPKSIPSITSTTSVGSLPPTQVKEASTSKSTTDSTKRNGVTESRSGDRSTVSESLSSIRPDRSDRSDRRSKTESGTDLRDTNRRVGRARSWSRSRSRSPHARNRSDRSPVRDLRERLEREPVRRSRYPDRRRDFSPPRRYGGTRNDAPFRRRRSPFRPRSRSRSRSRSRPRMGLRGRSRSRSRSRSPARQWSRSPRPRSPRPRSRTRSPLPRSASYSRSRSRSRSGSPRRRKPSSRSSTPPDYRVPEEPVGDRRHVTRPRCRDYDEKGFCMRGDLCPFDHGNDPVVVEDVNIPTVLGFPAGGPPPPGAPPPPSGPPPTGPPPPIGPPPPVGPPPIGPPPPLGPPPMMNIPPPGLRPPGPPPPGGPIGPLGLRIGPPPGMPPHIRPPLQHGRPDEGNPPPPGTVPVTMPQPPPLFRTQPPPGFPPDPPYNPEAPSIRTGGCISPKRTVIAGKRPHGDGPNFPQGHMGFDNRQGPRRPERTFEHNNTCLEVKKIPREINNIAKINEHFGKFGTLVNIQVQYEGDPEAALITFASHLQANTAYRSSEAVFNNRFIKVFWHHKIEKDENKNSGFPSKPTIPPAHKLQLNKNNMNKKMKFDKSNESVVVSSTGAMTKTVFNYGAGPRKSVYSRLGTKPDDPAVQAAVAKKKALLASKMKEAMAKKLEIQKQKQALLEKQINNQRALLHQLDKNKNISPEDKEALIKMIKLTANNIDTLKQDLKDPVTGSLPSIKPTPGSDTVVVKPATTTNNPPEAQKAILDTELDIMNRESEGADTSELRRKVSELKRQAAAMGLIGRGRGSGRGLFVMRGRPDRGLPVFSTAHSVDRRPKHVLVTGYMPEEKEQLESHMKMFGEIELMESDDNVPNLMVCYKTRAEAEIAVYEGAMFKGRRLSMTFQQLKVTEAHAINPNYMPDVGSVSGPDSTQDDEPVSVKVSPHGLATDVLEENAGDLNESTDTLTVSAVVLDEGVEDAGVEDDLEDDLLEDLEDGDDGLLADSRELDDVEAQLLGDEEELLDEEEDDEEEVRSWRR